MLTIQLTAITGGTHTSFFFLLSLSFFGIFTNRFCAWEGRRSNSGDAPARETPLLLLTKEDGPRDAPSSRAQNPTKDASEVRASPARGASPRCSRFRSCSPWCSHTAAEPRDGREPRRPIQRMGGGCCGALTHRQSSTEARGRPEMWCCCSLPLTTSSSSKGGRRGRRQQGLELAVPRLRVRLGGLLLRGHRAQGGKRHSSMRRRLGSGWRQHRAAAGRCSR